MPPLRRRLLYAIGYETGGIAVAGLGLMGMAEAPAGSSLVFSALCAAVAMGWSVVFNSAFEAWEARQPRGGRGLARRTAHAVLFEGGLVLLLLPLTAWWFSVGLAEALAYEAGLITLFLAYSWVYTWAFDRVFGLPPSARRPGG